MYCKVCGKVGISEFAIKRVAKAAAMACIDQPPLVHVTLENCILDAGWPDTAKTLSATENQCKQAVWNIIQCEGARRWVWVLIVANVESSFFQCSCWGATWVITQNTHIWMLTTPCIFSAYVNHNEGWIRTTAEWIWWPYHDEFVQTASIYETWAMPWFVTTLR